MSGAVLEHVNVTVSDPARTAQLLCDLFGWRVRWQGDAKNGGTSYHVGGEDSYVVVYSAGATEAAPDPGGVVGGLNHFGIVVEDLDAVEARVRAAGLEPHSHANYEPGRRFYFHDADGIEVEVVSYTG